MPERVHCAYMHGPADAEKHKGWDGRVELSIVEPFTLFDPRETPTEYSIGVALESIGYSEKDQILVKFTKKFSCHRLGW